MPGRGANWRGVGKGLQDRIGSGEIEDDSLLSEDIKDGTIKEVDLDSALQTKVNSGGGHQIQDEGTPLTDRTELNFTGEGVTASDDGEKTVVDIPGGGSGSGGWIATRLYAGTNAGFDESYDAMFVSPEDSGEAASFGSPMPKAGKIESIRANVFSLKSSSSANTTVQIRKNGSVAMTLSFDGGPSGSTGIKEQTTPVTFAKDDLLDILVNIGAGTGSITFSPVIEYSFD